MIISIDTSLSTVVAHSGEDGGTNTGKMTWTDGGGWIHFSSHIAGYNMWGMGWTNIRTRILDTRDPCNNLPIPASHRKRRKRTMKDLGITTEVEYSYSEAIEKNKQIPSEHGFGVLSEIEVSEKLKEKPDVDIDDYMVLGARKPEKAYQSLQEEQELGLLLPCNTTVYRKGSKTFVSTVKVSKAHDVTGNEDLEPIAEEVEKKTIRKS